MRRIWIDASLCDGCLNCTLACMNAHRPDQETCDCENPGLENSGLENSDREKSGQESSGQAALDQAAPAPAALSQNDIYTLDLTDPANESRNVIRRLKNGEYRPIFCRHCDEPECVRSCMSGALTKNPETGLVEYDEKRCAACFMCVMNCPFGVLKPDSQTKSRILKCDFCKDSGGEPNCVKACPKKAIWIEEVES